MITNQTKKIMSSLDSLPEIKNKNKTTFGSGMMSPLLKKQKTSNSTLENEPVYIIAKMYQQMKRNRLQIKEAKQNGN